MSLAGCSHEAAEEVESETVVPVTTEPAAIGTIRATLTVTGTVTAAPGADQLVDRAASRRASPRSRKPKAIASAPAICWSGSRFPRSCADVATKRGEVDARPGAHRERARRADARARSVRSRRRRPQRSGGRRPRAGRRAGRRHRGAGHAGRRRNIGRAERPSGPRFDGVVAKRYHNPGDLVEAASTRSGACASSIRKRLEVTASVPIPDVPHDRRSAPPAQLRNPPATAQIAAEGGLAAGGRRSRTPRRSRFVWRSPPPDVAPVGTPVQVTIDAEEHRDVVLVPAAAVMHEAEETAVFVANGDKAERRVVTLGLVDDDARRDHQRRQGRRSR